MRSDKFNHFRCSLSWIQKELRISSWNLYIACDINAKERGHVFGHEVKGTSNIQFQTNKNSLLFNCVSVETKSILKKYENFMRSRLENTIVNCDVPRRCVFFPIELFRDQRWSSWTAVPKRKGSSTTVLLDFACHNNMQNFFVGTVYFVVMLQYLWRNNTCGSCHKTQIGMLLRTAINGIFVRWT